MNIIIDTSIEAPSGLSVQPTGWSIVNSFNLSWTNPTDKTGIIGVYYKLDSVPDSDTDGTYIAGNGIDEIIGIEVSGNGNHTIYIWLRDTAGNIDFSKNNYTYLCLNITIAPSDDDGDGGGGGGSKPKEQSIPGFNLIITFIASITATISIAISLRKKNSINKKF